MVPKLTYKVSPVGSWAPQQGPRGPMPRVTTKLKSNALNSFVATVRPKGTGAWRAPLGLTFRALPGPKEVTH